MMDLAAFAVGLALAFALVALFTPVLFSACDVLAAWMLRRVERGRR